MVDEHYYKPPEWFFKNAGRYDEYDRDGIKVFAGEYAAHGKESKEPESRNSWYSALAEAAFMTGLDRNADIVNMCSYAPLLAHVEAWQWRPDLIWFDNLNSLGTPNYYVQKIFSNHSGTDIIPIQSDGGPLIGQDSLYASATRDSSTGELYVKLVNISSETKPVQLNIKGLAVSKDCDMEILKSQDKYAFNSIEDPVLIYPEKKQLVIRGRNINIALDPFSVNVVTLKYKK